MTVYDLLDRIRGNPSEYLRDYTLSALEEYVTNNWRPPFHPPRVPLYSEEPPLDLFADWISLRNGTSRKTQHGIRTIKSCDFWSYVRMITKNEREGIELFLRP